ncbi:hypothetical protein [Roseiarcus sp.]|uniref:hypothetical protein n=1 Tax=Roseiarcus sp. TaxID=1969460 RepID=UPI003F9E8421
MSYDSNLIDALEPSQLTAATEIPLPRRRLSRATTILLIALRVYIFIAVPIVGYAFVHALMAPQ